MNTLEMISCWGYAPEYDADRCNNGGAYAGGYGYHRASAAADAAIKRAGITLSDSISGIGDAAIRDALKAIGVACGISPVVIDAHA